MASRNGERRLLQATVAVLGLVPTGAGLAGAVLGPAMIAGWAGSADADSHYRYLSGLLLAIGFGFWSTIPRIEERSGRFRLLTGLVLIGGLARAWSLAQVGLPTGPMIFGLIMELAVTPLLCAWQTRIAREYTG